MDMDSTKASEYLSTLLNKKLRVYTNDSRMFLGDFKCTDNVGHAAISARQPIDSAQERNIILSQAFEYRQPAPNALKTAAEACSTPSAATTVKVDMTSRFLGLIVVPGQHIIKIELEET
ncbi:hypothetical protein MMC28_009572 [Mycoblastus sanguinarius]|nr:hypothetical protein [Mycoblastus sanguinarius]